MKTQAEKLQICKAYLTSHGYKVIKAEAAPKSAARAKRPINADGWMRQKEILEIFPVSSATFWRRITAGEFPQPVKLSGRVTAWKRAEVMGYLNALADAPYVKLPPVGERG